MELPLTSRLLDRSEFLRSSAEAADRQVRSFHVHSLEPLIRMVGLSPTHRVLNLGGSVGVLGGHLASVLNRPRQLVVQDSDPAYFQARVPESLRYESNNVEITGDPLNQAFSDSEFDLVIAYDFLRWFTGDELDYLLAEVRRLLTDDGHLVVLEDLNERQWLPDDIHFPEEERDRQQRLGTLLEEFRKTSEQDLERSIPSLPAVLQDRGWEVSDTNGWFQPLRLNDSRWTERQRTDLINLRHQAQRDRLERLRRLMERSDFWSGEYGPLFRNLAADYQQHSLRLRKALETGDETGWTGFETLVIRAEAN